jgi:hypothetical protein
MIQRRRFFLGIVSALAAPAIVRASSLMPVKALVPEVIDPHWVEWTHPKGGIIRVQFKILVDESGQKRFLLPDGPVVAA